MSKVPAANRTGVITERGGLCLDLNGGVVFDTNHIQVYDCNGTTAQVWTMASDGTLRVSGKCAQAGAGAEVRITTCGDQADAQWRAGRNNTLVNLATSECLTDPGDGRRSGSGVRTQSCDGDSNQRWDLP